MPMTICTIGFAGKSAEEFFALLRNAGVQQVIDIRQKRSGQLSGFAKDPDLAYFLQSLCGMSYRHEPLLAPTAELLKVYRTGRNWQTYEAGFLALMKERDVPESLGLALWPSRIALLCSEATPEHCHRRLVAQILALHLVGLGHEVEVRHLLSNHQASQKRARKRKSPR
jgi:uncharacterized protein (DUF488 family)